MKKLVSKAVKIKMFAFGLLAIVATILVCTGVLASVWFAIVPAIVFAICVVWHIIDKHIHKPTPIQDEAVRQYLSQYNCHQCGNACTLDAVRCHKGAQEQQQQLQQYSQQ